MRATRRKLVLGIALAAVILASAGGWAAARQIRSPAEIAARTAAPDPSLISVPVEKRRLTSDVVVRGTVGYGSPLAVPLPKSALKTGTTIVTTAPAKGASLSEGSVALTVSGRPVLVLQGAQPAYRDLGPGAQGADVAQLEEALARLGFDPGPRDGRYDGSTAAAVQTWYRKAGWEPFGPTDEQLKARRGAEADLFTARSDSLNAEETLNTARTTKATAGTDVATKRNARNAAAADPSAVAAAQSDLTAAETALSVADQAVEFAQRRVSLTQERVTALEATVTDAAAQLGIQVPANELLFFPTLPLRIDDVPIRTGEEPVGPVMTVTNSQLAVSAALSASDTTLVRKGAPVTIEEPDLAVKAAGIVSDVANVPGTQGAQPGRFHLGVAPANAPPSLAGASVILTVTVGTTDGDVLAVPVAALSVGADGTSRVQVQRGKASTRDVTVTPGLAAKGMVAVTPVAGRLNPGDLVVVGTGGGKSRGK